MANGLYPGERTGGRPRDICKREVEADIKEIGRSGNSLGMIT